jgi:hypothetical protein
MTTETRGDAKFVDAPAIPTSNPTSEVNLQPSRRARDRKPDLVATLVDRLRALIVRARSRTGT